jgi:hypothetical protein
VTRGGWVAAPKLTSRHRSALRRELGDNADRFAERAEAALRWYSIAQDSNTRSATPRQVNDELHDLAIAARRLAEALDALDPRTTEALDVARYRSSFDANTVSSKECLRLADLANRAQVKLTRGARNQEARAALIRKVGDAFFDATGRRPGLTDGGPFERALTPILEAAKIPTRALRPLLKKALRR